MGFEEVEFGSRKAVSIRPVERPAPAARKEAGANRSEAVAIPGAEQAGYESRQPQDGVLVPLDQWTKLLNQLGNLHRAGQDLADARERAARAETEAMFLKERLRELREEMHRRPTASEPSSATLDITELENDDDIEGEVQPNPALDRVLVVKLPSRLTRWWLARKGQA